MRVSKIYYERLRKRSERFENERVGIEISLTKGDDPKIALRAARIAVERELEGYDDELVEQTLGAAETAVSKIKSENRVLKLAGLR